MDLIRTSDGIKSTVPTATFPGSDASSVSFSWVTSGIGCLNETWNTVADTAWYDPIDGDLYWNTNEEYHTDSTTYFGGPTWAVRDNQLTLAGDSQGDPDPTTGLRGRIVTVDTLGQSDMVVSVDIPAVWSASMAGLAGVYIQIAARKTDNGASALGLGWIAGFTITGSNRVIYDLKCTGLDFSGFNQFDPSVVGTWAAGDTLSFSVTGSGASTLAEFSRNGVVVKSMTGADAVSLGITDYSMLPEGQHSGLYVTYAQSFTDLRAHDYELRFDNFSMCPA